jgi:NAD(P)-dependent dehydrogenase (short-subunit alcohol dehydrogenase family)
VVLLDVDLASAQAVATALGPNVRAHQLDVADDRMARHVVDEILADEGRIDHLVNCAATFVAAGRDAKRAQWDRAFAVNVIGPAMLTAYVSSHMQGGTVVNVSSISAHAAQPDRWTYNSTKAAILALTRGQALDLREQNIRVNSVSPGWIWTPEVSRAAGDDRALWELIWGRYHILERLGTASEVADAVLYLSGSTSAFITGTELFVDGGYSALGPEGLGDSARFAGSGS